MLIPQKQIKEFQKTILDWYEKNKRQIPWREIPHGISLPDRTYRIFVSEMMLQQTQVVRVIPKYIIWMRQFPSVEILANASAADVLQHWSGLGYNRRALYLHNTAKIIMYGNKGVWPQTIEGLKKLPGIGEYTARAIACFALKQQIAVVDTNVRKVLLTQIPAVSTVTRTLQPKELQAIADQLLPKGRAYDWNQALMDYAAANLAKTKINSQKQSRFIGSRRYYRGKLLKLLLAQRNIPLISVGPLIKEDYTAADKQWMEGLLMEMERDGFIYRNKTEILLVK